MSTAQPARASLQWAHPLVRDWFARKFDSPTEPQEQGWPHIVGGRSVLISAPTGSGKTLAAFLAAIDGLVRKALEGGLSDQTEVLYVSPLKALGNDIHKNLETPLAEILALAGERGLLMPPIRAAVRTGDTLMPERQAMLRRPPHILVTTPESLYILLTAERSRQMLRTVRTVIVDEIHAVADDKRGAHLTLSLERLEALAVQPPVRIGLSATQKPIELIAEFLSGSEASERPQPVVVQIGHRREMDVAVQVPGSELGAVATHEMWDEVYDRVADLTRQHRSTLIFVNTRRLAERVAHHLTERLGAEAVAAHHGSLSRKLRLSAEKRLKAGELRALVATASLELGIDIGEIDLVCQIGSPRAISVALQRIGRAGHWRGATPKGRLFATTRDELLECAALVRGIRSGDLDRIEIPDAPLDILAQQIVAMCAVEAWRESELFDCVRNAYPYRNLSREDFDSLLEMLAEGIAGRRGRYGALLHRDRVNGRVSGRRGARLTAITNGGAIPDNALYTVVAEPEGTVVGTVDEDFAVESMRGDIMLLGSTSWRIRRVGSGRVIVEDAHGAAPNIPFWRGEAPARTAELSENVAALRTEISSRLGSQLASPVGESNPAVTWLASECGLDRAGAEQAVEYVAAGRAELGAVPTQACIIAERFFDESGGMQLVIHAPFGGRINKAWGLALRKRFCRSFNFELQAAATDEGINISLTEQHSFPLADVFRFLHPNSVAHVLEQAVLASPIFAARWRWNGNRSLAVPRFRSGNKVAPQIQRMLADDLLAACFPEQAACPENLEGPDVHIPDHLLVRQTLHDAVTEALDVHGLKRVLERIYAGEIECRAAETPAPSQFCHEILNANPYAYLDDAPLEERRARAVQMRRTLPQTVLEEVGRLDPAAIEEVRRDAWPDVRNADELSDALQTLIALPLPAEADRTAFDARIRESLAAWRPYLDELVADRRVTLAYYGTRTCWTPAERAKALQQIFPAARFESALPEIDLGEASRDEAIARLLAGWLSHVGPAASSDFQALFGLPAAERDAALLRLEATGAILRGKFTATATTTEWCDRRLLARIHRLTLGGLRKQIEPVTAADFMSWLLRWQHVAPSTQVLGDRGALEVLRQLQGFEAPANSWESQILRRRIANYNPRMLDDLCLKGEVGWGRLSPHPATLPMVGQKPAQGKHEATNARRVTPSSVAPITFFVRDEAEWMLPRRGEETAELRGLSHAAREAHDFLQKRGASFFADLVRGTGRLKAEVETALWELVAAGLVTADSFDNLRALIDPRRRAGQGSGRTARPRHTGGRWSLLYSSEGGERAAAIEATCALLLRRYGVVFREALGRESLVPTWRELLIALRRMEDRGEVRGGRFVNGFVGEQFALPVAVESLRAARRGGQAHAGELANVSAADPLNLVGIILPGERVAANSGRVVTFRDGVPLEAQEVALSV